MLKTIKTYLTTPIKAAPLAVFRILFGALMCFAIIRFLAHDWVNEFYIEPQYFFSYYGFEFVKPFGQFTYILFAIAFFSALGILLGYKYRISSILFFLSFTYIELMDKTTYLNHYYFVSLVSFILIFLPANAYFSVDAKRNPNIAYNKIPRYTIFVLQLMLSIVYFYAGLAKINSDWLLEAQPLKIWLTSKYDFPLLGDMFQQRWMHFVMSWSGMLYDLAIPFLLFYKPTRSFAYLLVIVFHVLTRLLFPIGIFPFVMILATLIFFDANFHERIIQFIKSTFRIKYNFPEKVLEFKSSLKQNSIVTLFIGFFAIQFLLPFRYVFYPDELFWTEEGYRFSWRVMLIEKVGFTNFKVVNPETGKQFYVDNNQFLTQWQQKQMNMQADFILQYAKILENYYKNQGIKNPEIYVESYVTLNGRGSQPFIDPTVDLTKQNESFKHKTWILPFNDTIYGF